VGARYYDPQLGPSGKESNPYAYAAGDPANRIDPSGLDFLGLSGVNGSATAAKRWGLPPSSYPAARS
jgi:uncharacterized protein RhaS with RHS repeats